MKWEDLVVGDVVLYNYQYDENNNIALCIGKILLDEDDNNTVLRDMYIASCDGTTGRYANTLPIENVITNDSFILLGKLDEKDILKSITEKYPEYFI